MASPKIFALRQDDGAGMTLTIRSVDLSGTGVGPFIPAADNEPERATYGAFLYGLVPPATPTDFVYLQGAGAKVMRLKSLILSGTATAATNIPVYLYKRTANYTGGVATTQSAGQHDTSDSASAATLKYFTTLPTGLGTGAIINGGRLNLAPAANGSIDRLMFQYAWMNDKAPVLRTSTDYLAINFGGLAWPSGGAIDVAFEWTEE